MQTANQAGDYKPNWYGHGFGDFSMTTYKAYRVSTIVTPKHIAIASNTEVAV